MSATLLIVGSGTIGGYLARVCAELKERGTLESFGIDRVIVSKHTPRSEDRAILAQLKKRGALIARYGSEEMFEKMGFSSDMTIVEAMNSASVIVDCSPKDESTSNKKNYYDKLGTNSPLKGVIVQGSATNIVFTNPLIYGVNDEHIFKGIPSDKIVYLKIPSCNTHALVSMMYPFRKCLVEADFELTRRSADVSQDGTKAKTSPTVDPHDSAEHGTHQGADAAVVFRTMGLSPRIFSSAKVIPARTMHISRLKLVVSEEFERKQVLRLYQDFSLVALTEHCELDRVFSFGREYGPFGRLWNYSVISTPTLSVTSRDGGSIVRGYAFTPQDANVIASTLCAIFWILDPSLYQEAMKRIVESYFPQEV